MTEQDYKGLLPHAIALCGGDRQKGLDVFMKVSQQIATGTGWARCSESRAMRMIGNEVDRRSRGWGTY